MLAILLLQHFNDLVAVSVDICNSAGYIIVKSHRL